MFSLGEMTRELIATGTLLTCVTSGAALADEPFDVSLRLSQAASLAPYYQQIVQQATAHYRGDLPGHIIDWLTDIPFPHPLQEIWDEPFVSVSLQLVSPNHALEPTLGRREK